MSATTYSVEDRNVSCAWCVEENRSETATHLVRPEGSGLDYPACDRHATTGRTLDWFVVAVPER